MKPVIASDASRFWKAMKAGQARVAILRLLSEGDLHGYGIMEQIRNRTAGFFSPTAGTIYPILQDLLKHGHVDDKWTSSGGRRKKRVYHITRKGQETLTALQEISREAEKAVRESLFKASKVLEIDEVPGITTPTGLTGVAGGWIHTLLSRVTDAQTPSERLKLLKNARRLIRARVEFLKERERLVSEQISLIQRNRPRRASGGPDAQLTSASFRRPKDKRTEQ